MRTYVINLRCRLICKTFVSDATPCYMRGDFNLLQKISQHVYLCEISLFVSGLLYAKLDTPEVVLILLIHECENSFKTISEILKTFQMSS